MSEPKLTFEKRAGWVNIGHAKACKGPLLGRVTYFHTHNGVPVVLPDQWIDNQVIEYIPEWVDVHYLGQHYHQTEEVVDEYHITTTEDLEKLK